MNNLYKLRNAYMTKIYNLSRISSNPTEAYTVMIQISKSNVRLQQAYYRRDLLSKLVNCDTPVNAVAQICMKACRGLSKHKVKIMRNMLMRWKLNDAHIELNKARKNQTKIRREGEPLLRRESRQLMNEFETLRDRERERVRTNLRVNSAKKGQFSH